MKPIIFYKILMTKEPKMYTNYDIMKLEKALKSCKKDVFKLEIGCVLLVYALYLNIKMAEKDHKKLVKLEQMMAESTCSFENFCENLKNDSDFDLEN